MKFQLRMVMVLEIVAFLSIAWPNLRELWLPSGTTPTHAFLVFLLLIIWEDVLRVKRSIPKRDKP